MGKGSGCGCLAGDEETLESRRIDRELAKERKRLKRQVKILLLGSGESGKSTFLKQMVIIHGRGEFTAEECRQYRQQIYQNVVLGMRVLVDARQKLALPWQDSAHQAAADVVFAYNAAKARSLDAKTFGELRVLVEELWGDQAIKSTYDQRSVFQIPDSCQYFFTNINRIAALDYVPTNKDILLCRKATRTITEHTFPIHNVPFRFVDVGGQRSQRQKWFQCFDGITASLFMVASNEYDQVIMEDRRTNRVLESRSIFETLVNNPTFANTPIILFLNKTDLLREKIALVDLRDSFPEFRGNPQSLTDVQLFLLDQFEGVRREKKKPLFYHFTVAVDTDNIRRVFQDCREIILEQNLNALMMQ